MNILKIYSLKNNTVETMWQFQQYDYCKKKKEKRKKMCTIQWINSKEIVNNWYILIK